VSPVLADAHVHFFRNGFPATRGGTVIEGRSDIEAYEALRAEHGIAASLVVGYEADGIDPENNGYIRALAATRPWMATLAYLPAHPAPDSASIEALLAGGHAGFAVYLPDAASASAFAAWPAELWHPAEERRAIVSLNARPEATDAAAAAVRGHAGCTFLFAHLGLPGRYPAAPDASQAAARIRPLLHLADCSQVRVKISGLYAVSDPPEGHPHAAARPFIELLLDRFGPGRCLWGSDFSPALEFVSFPQTAAVPWLDGLAREERELVMGRNLLKLLGRGDDR
jgi:predicted TIM-barrel fold metal-dependent hydrolase